MYGRVRPCETPCNAKTNLIVLVAQKSIENEEMNALVHPNKKLSLARPSVGHERPSRRSPPSSRRTCKPKSGLGQLLVLSHTRLCAILSGKECPHSDFEGRGSR